MERTAPSVLGKSAATAHAPSAKLTVGFHPWLPERNPHGEERHLPEGKNLVATELGYLASSRCGTGADLCE